MNKCVLFYFLGTSIDIVDGDGYFLAPDGLSDAILRESIKGKRFVFVNAFLDELVFLLKFSY